MLLGDSETAEARLPRVPTDYSKRNRFRGCLLGGAVGDALGAPVEFMSLREIRQRFGSSGIRDFVPAFGKLGAITDDTQMTLFTGEGLLRAYVRAQMKGLDPVFTSVTSHAYARWLKTQGFRSKAELIEKPPGWLSGIQALYSKRAPGNTCIDSLKKMEKFGQPARNDSKGCGGLMRVAPVGMFMANWLLAEGPTDERIGNAFEVASDVAAITHGHPTGQLTAGVLSVIVALLLLGVPLPGAIERAKLALGQHSLRAQENDMFAHGEHEETKQAIEKAQRLFEVQPGATSAVEKLGEGWVAEEALAISLYCALSATDFESGVALAVNHGGDSDSTGSITGNILGAITGAEAIPRRWLAALELRDVIEAMADDLATVRSWDIGEFVDSKECDFYWNRYPGI